MNSDLESKGVVLFKWSTTPISNDCEKEKKMCVNLLKNNCAKFNYTWHKISLVKGYSSLFKIKLQGETLLAKWLKCNDNFFKDFNQTSWVLVCLEIVVPLENFSLIRKRHHCRSRAANFGLCWALMAIEQ